VAVAEGFIPNAVHIKTPGNAEDIVLINPAICLFELPKTKDAAVTIDNIYYDFNKSTLRDESIATLDQLISMLNENKDMRIEIGSHTDSKGTDSYNQKLSEARARSVISFLISKGIDAARLEAKGYGESKPVAENTNADGSDNPDGRQKNRRTEFKILSKL
jgi:outer membrane protein OmpA-like peptidoglycan-associated protein